MFIRIVPINFDKLLQDGRSTTGTLDSKPSRVMEVAVNLTRVFVIAILRSKDSRTDRTGKMFDMKFQIWMGSKNAMLNTWILYFLFFLYVR